MLNKSIVNVEIKSHIKTLIVKSILAFVAVETHVFLPLNESNVMRMHL